MHREVNVWSNLQYGLQCAITEGKIKICMLEWM